jgi:hypothetical protein
MNTKTQLYLGTNIEAGVTVSDVAFTLFLANYVTPWFQGFTVYTAQGYWQGEPETVRVLEILHDGSGPSRESLLRIATSYRESFSQDCVLQVDSEAKAELV